MTVKIGSYDFEGPFVDPALLRNVSGVYAVLTRASKNDDYTVVDIGESATVRDRVTNHDRKDCWEREKKA